jgi:CSLREA domain-containing protein
MRTVLLRSVAAAALGSLLFAAGASANTITVTSNADPTGTAGTCTLRDAITAANTNAATNNCAAGDTTAANPDTIDFSLPGSPPNTIQLASALPKLDDVLTIDGPGPGSADLTVRGQGTYRVFDIQDAGTAPFPDVTLNDMTVTNGAGGILVEAATAFALNNVIVSGNSVASTSATQSSASGAGIESTGGATMNINSSTVSGNSETATTTGAGICCSVFAQALGAGIHLAQGGNLTIDQSTISGNQAHANGNQFAATNGAIYNEGQTTIDSSTISGNIATATVSEADGAGTAVANGGGITQQGGAVNLSLSRDTITGNTAAAVTSTAGGSGQAFGGGIYLNQTFADPLSGSVTGSTIAGNTVSQTGPGSPNLVGANVELDTNTGTMFTSKSTIFANGIGATNCFQGRDGTFASLGYNLDTGALGTSTSTDTCLRGGTTGDQAGVSSANLALGPLQNNGGPTFTMAPGLGSFAVDKGTRVGIGGVADQRGFNRNFDMNPTSGPPPDGDGTDVGAVEQSVDAIPSPNDFGSLQWGTTSGTQLFLMHNRTGNALPAGTVLGGANAGDFQRSSDGCTNTSITNNTFCTMDVAFHPVSPGNGVRNASLSFSVSPVELATLTGTATEYVSVAPTAHNFGSTQTGTPTGATQFVVTNTGPGTSGTFATTLAGPNASEFGITANTCAGQTLAALATCTVSVRFAPATAGAKTATLNIIGTPGGTTSASLTGTATSPPPPPPAANTQTGQRSAALKKCKKKKSKQARKKCKKKANRLPV